MVGGPLAGFSHGMALRHWGGPRPALDTGMTGPGQGGKPSRLQLVPA
jgi:hypothetical protein